jgi:hypothetical protein
MNIGIPAPPTVHSPLSPVAMLAAWGGLAAAACCVAVWLSIRNRDVLPVAACIGAFICTLNEPIFDVVAKLTYAESPYVAYVAFGRAIPWTLVLGYIPWVGLAPYLLYRLTASGVSRVRLHAISGGLILSVILVEIINAIWLKAWAYYGQTPWRGVLGGGVVQMAAMPLLCAFFYLVFAHNSSVWRRACAGIIFPAVTLPMVFSATTWPLYVSNYSNASELASWTAAVIAVGLSLSAIPAITGLAVKYRHIYRGWGDAVDESAETPPPMTPSSVSRGSSTSEALEFHRTETQ